MSNPTIQAELRTDTGKGRARKLRRAGLLPAVAYGGTGKALILTINPRDLESLRKGTLGWNQPVNLEVTGGESVGTAILKAVDKHPISGQLLHADFIRLEEGAMISLQVPLLIEGEAPGVVEGGLLNVPQRSLPVRCLASNIPHGIAVNVSELELGNRVMLSEITLPAGVTTMLEDCALVSVVGRRGGSLEDELAALDAEQAEGEEGAEGAEGAAEGGDDSSSSAESE